MPTDNTAFIRHIEREAGVTVTVHAPYEDYPLWAAWANRDGYDEGTSRTSAFADGKTEESCLRQIAAQLKVKPDFSGLDASLSQMAREHAEGRVA